MPYRIRGTVESECRVLVFNESDMALERSGVFSVGDWELMANNANLKMVIARDTSSGESYGFGGIIPETYEEPDTFLAINMLGDLLAINSDGDVLIAGIA